ncbi:LytTR family DNA-binding domain-containing protein [Fulvivirga sp.]|uniref:LytR/AlgR family response regulator transcription factor n=1 Tax=Fulvivirga sp. TaxID=1931237 RepID=UPI0032F07F47
MSQKPSAKNIGIIYHVIFWIAYYVLFSFVWAKDGRYYESFGLEFILMPIIISASYLSMHYLMPRYLLKEKLLNFIGLYLLLILGAGLLQRIFIYYYYDLIFSEITTELFSAWDTIRAIILVNSTVLFLSALKMYDYWKIEKASNQMEEQSLVEIRADKRTYRVPVDSITYVEGLGNYVTYYFTDRKPLISYSSLKDIEENLSKDFTRIHKSFVINRKHIDSYTNENVQINDRIIPIGKSMSLEL